MVWFVVMQVFSTLLEWVRVGRKTEQEKDLEILLLRRHLAIMERKRDKPVLDENSHPFKIVICVKLPAQPVIYARIDFLTLTGLHHDYCRAA